MKRLTFIVLSFSLMLFGFSTQTQLMVTSPAFSAGSMIPAKYTCEGAEVSPPLKFRGVPAGAKSLALILHDPDEPEPGGVTHWVVWNLSNVSSV